MKSGARVPTGPDAPVAAPWGGALLNLASRALAMVLGLAILVTVARQGAQVQGAFSLFVAIEAALVALGSGLGLLLAREAAQASGAISSGRLRRALGLASAAGLIAAMLLLVASKVSDEDPYRHLWILALAAPCLLLVPTAGGLWMGQGRLLAMNMLQVASPAMALVLIGTGLGDILGVLIAWALARALVGLGAAGWALRFPVAAPHRQQEPAAASKDAWRFMALIAVANLVSLANYRASLFLIERLQGLREAGVYSVSMQVAELLWLLSWAMTVSAYASIGTRDAKAAIETTMRVVRLGLVSVLVGAPILGALAWVAVPMALGEEYRASIVPMLLLLPGVTVYAAASGMSAYYTQHRGQPHWAAGIAAISLVLTIALASWTVPRWGAQGAAFATSIAYIVAMGIAFGRFIRDTGLRWSSLWRGNDPDATQQAPA